MAPRRTRTAVENTPEARRNDGREEFATKSELIEIARAMRDLTRRLNEQMTAPAPAQVEVTPPDVPVAAPAPALLVPALAKPGIERFKKNGATTFKGREEPLDAEDWIVQCEKIFDVLDCSDADKVRFATFMLESEAGVWWRAQKRLLEEVNTVITWDVFKQEFYDKYFPDVFREAMHSKFLYLRQGTMTVPEYERQFTLMSRFGPELIYSDARKQRKFLEGLQTGLREALFPFTFTSYTELVKKAEGLAAERERNRNIRDKRLAIKASNDFQKRKRGNGNQDRNGNNGKERQPNGYRVKCYHCGGIGHMAKQCPSDEPINKGKAPVGGRVHAMIGAPENDVPEAQTGM